MKQSSHISNLITRCFTHTRVRRSQRQIEILLWTKVWRISSLSNDASVVIKLRHSRPIYNMPGFFFFLPSFPSLVPLFHPADIIPSSPNHPQTTLCASNAFSGRVPFCARTRTHVNTPPAKCSTVALTHPGWWLSNDYGLLHYPSPNRLTGRLHRVAL